MKPALKTCLALCLLIRLAVAAPALYADTPRAEAGGARPLPEPPTLASCLSNYLCALATNASRTWDYQQLSVATNRNVWTWPVNLSWLGMSSVAGMQTSLLTSNTIVLPAHASGAYVGQTIAFMDTNGVVWSTLCTNSVEIYDDEQIGRLRDALPPSVVPIWVFPPNLTNYISPPELGDLYGLPCVWMRKNGGSDTNHPASGTIQFSTLYTAGYTSPWNVHISSTAALTGPFGFGDWASSGDSGSPCFMVYSNRPVFLFETHNGFPSTGAPEGCGGGQGPFFNDPAAWSVMVANGLTNGLQIIDLSGLKRLR
jgi:hypothetical protein